MCNPLQGHVLRVGFVLSKQRQPCGARGQPTRRALKLRALINLLDEALVCPPAASDLILAMENEVLPLGRVSYASATGIGAGLVADGLCAVLLLPLAPVGRSTDDGCVPVAAMREFDEGIPANWLALTILAFEGQVL